MVSSGSLPRRLGRYELLRRLAQGGMGTIYLARLEGEHRFEKRFAIKTLREHASEDERFRNMFLDEMRIASLIDHPHVCSVVDAGTEDGTLYMVMEYCDGMTLSQIRRRLVERLPYEFYVRVLADAARGLHAAHELRDAQGEPLGVVHRDVSPQNIMVLRRGGVKVLDFGIARARDRTSNTRTGELKGKLAYMAPEQIRSDPIDRRADVWSLGVVLWEMCLDYNPFAGDNAAATVSNVSSQVLPDPSEVAADFPERLADVLRGALVRDPERRTVTAMALADQLERFLYDTGKPFGMQQVAEHVAALWESPEQVSATEEVVVPERRPAAPPLAAPRVHERVTAPVAAPPRDDGARTSAAGRARRVFWGRIGVLAGAVVVALVAAHASSGAPGADPEQEGADPEEGTDHVEPAEGAARRASIPPRPPDESEPPADPPEHTQAEPDKARPASTRMQVAEAEPAPEETEAEPAPPARRPAEPARDLAAGFVSVFAVPNAEVYLDGRRLGETPLRRPVESGRYRLVLRTADGHTETRAVRIRPGETERVSVLFDR